MKCFRLTLRGLRELQSCWWTLENNHDSQQLQESLTRAAASAELLPQWGEAWLELWDVIPWHARGARAV